MAAIEHLQILNVAPSKVYETLTTSEGLSEVWTSELAVDNREGGIHEFWFGPNDLTKMSVVELVPNERILWRCIDSDPEWIDTTVGFELEEKKGKTHLTLRHSNWREVTPFYRFCNYNWAIFLLSLKQYCEEGEGLPYQKRKF